MSDRVKPKPQTKEQIEDELSKIRLDELNARTAELLIQTMLEFPNAHEAIQVVGMLLGSVIGNTVNLDEDSIKNLCRFVFEKVENNARQVMTTRINLKNAGLS